MTRVTFGMSASSFAANMSVHQNAIDFVSEYPLSAKAVEESFYVHDGLMSADLVDGAIKLQEELQDFLRMVFYWEVKFQQSRCTPTRAMRLQNCS